MKDLLDQTSEWKQELIDLFNNSPFTVGEEVSVLEDTISSYTNDKKRTCQEKKQVVRNV